jgi:hypothetical protein
MGMGHPASALALVDPETFTPAEMRLAQVIVSTARGRGTMWRGRLAECQVALALNAQHADVGTSDWDLKLPDGKTIEVKSCGEGKSSRSAPSPTTSTCGCLSISLPTRRTPCSPSCRTPQSRRNVAESHPKLEVTGETLAKSGRSFEGA